MEGKHDFGATVNAYKNEILIALDPMARNLRADHCPKRIRGLEAHLVDDQVVVFEVGADRVHYLNAPAALILEFCDGKRSVGEIVTLVGEAYSLPDTPVDQVHFGLESLIAEGLIHL